MMSEAWDGVDATMRYALVHPGTTLVKDVDQRQRQYNVAGHLGPASKRSQPLGDRNGSSQSA